MTKGMPPKVPDVFTALKAGELLVNPHADSIIDLDNKAQNILSLSAANPVEVTTAITLLRITLSELLMHTNSTAGVSDTPGAYTFALRVGVLESAIGHIHSGIDITDKETEIQKLNKIFGSITGSEVKNLLKQVDQSLTLIWANKDESHDVLQSTLDSEVPVLKRLKEQLDKVISSENLAIDLELIKSKVYSRAIHLTSMSNNPIMSSILKVTANPNLKKALGI
jgi:hypothetical protein